VLAECLQNATNILDKEFTTGMMSDAGMDFGKMFTSTAIAAGVSIRIMAFLGTDRIVPY
jgi:hypothetical protein